VLAKGKPLSHFNIALRTRASTGHRMGATLNPARMLGGHVSYTGPSTRNTLRALKSRLNPRDLNFLRVETIAREMPKTNGLRSYLVAAEKRFDKFYMKQWRKAERSGMRTMNSEYGLIFGKGDKLLGAYQTAGDKSMIVGLDPAKPKVISNYSR
jgi:hypothetical protein